MKNNKRLVRLAAALIIVITMMLSLSSCIIDFGYFLPDFLPDADYENEGNGGGNGWQEINPPTDNGGGTNNKNNITSENYGEFYPGSGQGDTEGLSPISKTMLSTVTIICELQNGASAGSGVIYSIDKEKGDAYIITNQHVVYGAKSISVYLYGMELSAYAIPATLVGGSVTYDIAVIKVSSSEVLKNSYASAVSFADSDDARVFDRVYTVGNPEGSGLAATEGIISLDSENIELSGADNSIISLRVIRVDAAVNHGNSGGGLYDENGRLLGIVAAKEVSEDVDNMGYAIPSNLVKKVADSILYHCNGKTVTKISKALMGVTITAYVSGLEMDGNGDMYKVELVEVIEVSDESLAYGKAMVGDVINSITVDGVKQEVTRMHHVTDAMINARAGSVVVLNVTRGEAKIDITFKITASSMSIVN